MNASMQPRPIVRGATSLVTRRISQRQFLLKPSELTNRIFGYCLAYASLRTGILIHAVMVMSNHYHLVVTDPEGVLPSFMERLNKLVAKCMNASLGRWENLWATEPPSYVRLIGADAILDKIAYTVANPVEAGLVERGAEWPGVVHYKPGSFRVKRPPVFFRPEGGMPDELVLEIVPPPLEGMTPDEATRAVAGAVRAREEALRQQARRQGRKFLGAHAVLRQKVLAGPTTPEPRRVLSPQVATRNKWLRIEALTRNRAFVVAYRDALARWKIDRTVEFPAGTFAMRLRHQVRCSEV
jgi:hypothetical protein